MKVENINKENFKPITIQITLESEEELGALYGLLNFTPICDELMNYGINSERIREEIGTKFSPNGELFRGFLAKHWKGL